MSVFHTFEKWTKGDVVIYLFSFSSCSLLSMLWALSIHRVSNILKVRDFRKQLFLS